MNHLCVSTCEAIQALILNRMTHHPATGRKPEDDGPVSRTWDLGPGTLKTSHSDPRLPGPRHRIEPTHTDAGSHSGRPLVAARFTRPRFTLAIEQGLSEAPLAAGSSHRCLRTISDGTESANTKRMRNYAVGIERRLPARENSTGDR